MWVESDLLRHKGIYRQRKVTEQKEKKEGKKGRTACSQCAPVRAGIVDCVIKKKKVAIASMQKEKYWIASELRYNVRKQ